MYRLNQSFVTRIGTRLVVSLLIFMLLAVTLAACGTEAQNPTLPPRPTVIVVTASGPYSTGFDDEGEWLVGEDSLTAGRVFEGRYWLSVAVPTYLAWTNQPREFGEGMYEVEARLVSGPEASAFGLILLASPDMRSFYYAMITGDGRFDIGQCLEGCQTQESLIGGLTLAYPILTGNETNFLRVVFRDGELRLDVNGAPAGQVQGIETETGLLGFIGESGHYGGFEANFDNLRVTEDQETEP